MMMDVMELSPYLSGIQKVAGSKPGDKFNTLNRIAKKIIESKNQNDSMEFAINSSEIPEALKPLVQVEVARLSGQFEGICEALKSDDAVVFDRALRAKWFFNGSHENCRVQYYQAEIFPVVSLQSRLKIIKALAKNLTVKPAIAEEFYTALTLMYGEKQAHPLLKACSESFIWNCVTENKVWLSSRIVRILFNKYPDLVVKYLKLTKNSDDELGRNYRPFHSHSLSDFLPRLIKKYPDTFVELLEIPGRFYNIYLRHTRTELFLNNSIDALMKNATLFMGILSPDIVAKRLTDNQIKIVIQQFLPPELESFDFESMFTYSPGLNFLSHLPEEKMLPLITSAFEEVYKVNFLVCTEKITLTAMRLLPRDERIKQARIKMQHEPPGKFRYSARPWVCYLPCEESIPYLKDLIKKSSDSSKRCELLSELIYTCVVNSDNDALLEVLKYITTRHRNEPSFILSEVFRILLREYALKNLLLEHWEVLYSFTKFLYVKNKFDYEFPVLIDLLKARIVFDLENDCSITDKVSSLVEYNIHHAFSFEWKLMQDNLSYERKYLDELIRALSSVSDDKKKYSNAPFVHYIMELIYGFNKSNLKAKSPMEKMSIANYPWILNFIKEFLNDENSDKRELKYIKETLEEEEKEIYDTLVTEDEEEIDLNSRKISRVLKNSPERIMKNWEFYLEKCMDEIKYPWTRRFVKFCRWFQDLPIKFAEKSLNEVTEKKQYKGLIILGLLFEGSAFAQIAEAFVPTTTTIDADEEDAAADYQMSSTTPMAFNVVNPPVSLDLTLKFCVGDYIHTAVNCLDNVSRRTALPEVISFATTLMDRPVSIKKHGIRLLCTVADVKQLRGILMNLWRFETHQTIRTLVFQNVFKVFESIPNDETWRMISECIEGLKPDDKDTFESLMKFDSIPNEYIAEYVHKLFSLFHRLGDAENGLQPDVVWPYIEKILNINQNIFVLFSEELHSDIIDKYVLDLSLPENVLSTGHHYLVNYLAIEQNKFEDRLERFKNVFIKIVNENWNNPHPTIPLFYPANYFVRNLANILITLANQTDNPCLARFIEVALEAFNSTLKPQQAPFFYVHFSFASLFAKERFSAKEVARKVNELLPSLIEIFSAETFTFISSCLAKYLKSYFSENTTENLLNVAESLIELNNDQAAILAAQFLAFQNDDANSSRIFKIFDILKGHSNPVVVSIAYILS